MRDNTVRSKCTLTFYALLAVLMITGACSPATSLHRDPTLPPLAKEITLFDWVDDIPGEVLDSFQEEFGVRVKYSVYDSQEAAVEQIKKGEAYDVVVMDDRNVLPLIQDNLLAQLDKALIPNLVNVSNRFRNRPYDLQNLHSVPYSYGTTGIIFRSDKVQGAVNSWKDFWNQTSAGKVILWRGNPREQIGMVLKSLGYSVNSENPAQLDQALSRLLELKKNAIFAEDLDPNTETLAPLFAKGYGIMGFGWANDALSSKKEVDQIDYVLPAEGSVLWGDNFVIPVNSKNKATAEVFINYLLRPEISAQIINFKSYLMPNEAAIQYVKPELLSNPIVFPKQEELSKGEWLMALSPAGQHLHEDIWQKFLDAP